MCVLSSVSKEVVLSRDQGRDFYKLKQTVSVVTLYVDPGTAASSTLVDLHVVRDHWRSSILVALQGFDLHCNLSSLGQGVYS